MERSKARRDRITKGARSALMARIKGKNTAFELAVFSELRRRRVKFRSHYDKVIGKPDLALPQVRKAVFLHSDFWHGWRFPAWKQILPSDSWMKKIERNRRRDQHVLRSLRRKGWSVLVVWEHQIKRDPSAAVDRIETFLIADTAQRRGRRALSPNRSAKR